MLLEGKRGLVLDLESSEADRACLRQLVARADVVLDSYAPGTLERWELGYESLVAGLPEDHPGLVGCAITPFGHSGPYAHLEAHDLVVVAMGGNAWMLAVLAASSEELGVTAIGKRIRLLKAIAALEEPPPLPPTADSRLDSPQAGGEAERRQLTGSTMAPRAAAAP